MPTIWSARSPAVRRAVSPSAATTFNVAASCENFSAKGTARPGLCAAPGLPHKVARQVHQPSASRTSSTWSALVLMVSSSSWPNCSSWVAAPRTRALGPSSIGASGVAGSASAAGPTATSSRPGRLPQADRPWQPAQSRRAQRPFPQRLEQRQRRRRIVAEQPLETGQRKPVARVLARASSCLAKASTWPVLPARRQAGNQPQAHVEATQGRRWFSVIAPVPLAEGVDGLLVVARAGGPTAPAVQTVQIELRVLALRPRSGKCRPPRPRASNASSSRNIPLTSSVCSSCPAVRRRANVGVWYVAENRNASDRASRA